MRVGVLALQGDFEAHQKAFARLGVEAFPVRTAGELEQVGGLVIPGGESTTMLKLLHAEELFEPLRRYGERRPIFGTCAGAILLASRVTKPRQESLALIDMEIERNGYGRQIDSRVARVPSPDGEMEAVFIRAPVIRSVGSEVKVLASYQDSPILVEQGRHLAATFHPELTGDLRVQRWFLDKIGR